MDFDKAFDLLIGHEGGYSNHSADPGGATAFGISKRSYPDLDIKALTVQDARAIYYRDFWSKLPQVSDSLRFHLFDCAVNSGIRRATMLLQEVVGVVPDGQWGPKSKAAYQALPPIYVEIMFTAERLLFMVGLSTWPTFSRGWSRRIASNLKQLAEDMK